MDNIGYVYCTENSVQFYYERAWTKTGQLWHDITRFILDLVSQKVYILVGLVVLYNLSTFLLCDSNSSTKKFCLIQSIEFSRSMDVFYL